MESPYWKAYNFSQFLQENSCYLFPEKKRENFLKNKPDIIVTLVGTIVKLSIKNFNLKINGKQQIIKLWYDTTFQLN